MIMWFFAFLSPSGNQTDWDPFYTPVAYRKHVRIDTYASENKYTCSTKPSLSAGVNAWVLMAVCFYSKDVVFRRYPWNKQNVLITDYFIRKRSKSVICLKCGLQRLKKSCISKLKCRFESFARLGLLCHGCPGFLDSKLMDEHLFLNINAPHEATQEKSNSFFFNNNLIFLQQITIFVYECATNQ